MDDDEVQISASNLAYGLVEEAWGFVDDEEGLVNRFNLAHDQELYAFEGRTNTPLEPNPDVRDALYFGWENGFEQGYKRALADAVDELRGERAEVMQRYG